MNMSFFTLKSKTENTLTSLRLWVVFLPTLLDSSLIGCEHSQVDILIRPLVFTYPWADAERHDLMGEKKKGTGDKSKCRRMIEGGKIIHIGFPEKSYC